MLINFNSDLTSVSGGIIAHGVNCQGVMNSGVARTIRNKWPIAYTEYVNFCDAYGKDGLLGKVNLVIISSDLIIANCFTQLYYGNDGKRYADVNAIEQSMTEVFKVAAEYSMPIALPKIGCGLGGLSWVKEVQPLIIKLANKYEIQTAVYDTALAFK